MLRWTLNAIGVALLAAPLLMARIGVLDGLGMSRRESPLDGVSGWLNLSIAAGAQMIEWSPVLIGAFILYFANRRKE
jgi:hypothetical protein